MRFSVGILPNSRGGGEARGTGEGEGGKGGGERPRGRGEAEGTPQRRGDKTTRENVSDVRACDVSRERGPNVQNVNISLRKVPCETNQRPNSIVKGGRADGK